MSEKLTKSEWEKKILDCLTMSGNVISPELESWWFRDNSSGMRLTKQGFLRCNQIGIDFNKYECEIKSWTGALIIGLSRIQAPFYIEEKKEPSMKLMYNFYIADEEYAMLLMFANNDLSLFTKGFLL
jgi:hypothetical protein